MERIGIIGIGMTKVEANKKGETFADMAWEAVNRALSDAGMTIDDVDNIVTTSNDFWDGRTISCMAVGDASGGRNKNISCVEGDGTFGAFYGLLTAEEMEANIQTALQAGQLSLSPHQRLVLAAAR